MKMISPSSLCGRARLAHAPRPMSCCGSPATWRRCSWSAWLPPYPDRIKKMTNRIREVRGGKLSDSGFFTRHQGQGTYWKVIEQLFELGRRKAGFPDEDDRPIPNTFRRPGPEQTRLFQAESP